MGFRSVSALPTVSSFVHSLSFSGTVFPITATTEASQPLKSLGNRKQDQALTSPSDEDNNTSTCSHSSFLVLAPLVQQKLAPRKLLKSSRHGSWHTTTKQQGCKRPKCTLEPTRCKAILETLQPKSCQQNSSTTHPL